MTWRHLDWREPERRREAFQRFYSFHLKYRTHPGCVYFLLPEMARHFWGEDPSLDQLAWMVWLNGNTQNPVTTQMLLEAAPDPSEAQAAIDFWSRHFKLLEWDTDRRHQKGKFGEATEKWLAQCPAPGEAWLEAAQEGWKGVWAYSFGQPYMGRLSAWSMAEYARILLPGLPDSDTLLLKDKSGSQSHRNSLAFIAGFDAVYWEPEVADLLGIVPQLEELGESLLQEARERNPGHPDVGYLTMESALCTYKSWHKPNRRYPNVYADMHYERIRKAESRFERVFDLQWEARARNLPRYLRLEETPEDPGLTGVKQNHYLQTGQIIMMDREWPDLKNDFNEGVRTGLFGTRKDTK